MGTGFDCRPGRVATSRKRRGRIPQAGVNSKVLHQPNVKQRSVQTQLELSLSVYVLCVSRFAGQLLCIDFETQQDRAYYSREVPAAQALDLVAQHPHSFHNTRSVRPLHHSTFPGSAGIFSIWLPVNDRHGATPDGKSQCPVRPPELVRTERRSLRLLPPDWFANGRASVS